VPRAEFDYYKVLYEIARDINSTLAVDKVLNALVDGVTGALGVKGCSLMLLSPDRKELIHTVAYGLSDWYVKKGPLWADDAISGVLKGRPLAIMDMGVDPRVRYREQAIKEGIVSTMSVPIRLDEEIIGIIRVYSAERRKFTQEEVGFLSTAANLGAMALEKAKAHESLGKDYQQRLLEIEQSRRELARLEEAKNQLMRFISVVAHDLKSPLAAIQSYFGVLLGGYSGPLTDKQKQMIERSSQRIGGLLELISDLLDISRVELGWLPKEAKVVRPIEVLKTPIDDTMAAAQQKGLKFEVNVAPDVPSICASPVRLQQVFANLLNNAVKFTPPGGTVSLVATRRDGDVLFEVSDTGIGIPSQDLPRMFEEFFRASNTQGLGTGLGLAIVRRVVEAHCGKVWVESPPPGTAIGTRFTVLLPAASESMLGKGGQS